MIEVIEKVLLFDDHQDSTHSRAISTTTLIGSDFKAQRSMLKDGTKKTDLNPMMRRSSALGTGFHMRAEQALANDPEVDAMEVFAEKYVEDYDVWISGKFDVVYDGHIMDWKTSYGKSFSPGKLTQASLQMSIYRWLNQNIHMENTAYVLFVSQSNNAYDSYPVQLMSLEETEEYVISRVEEIIDNKVINCKANLKYNPCSYCDLDELACKKIELSNAASF